MYTFVGRNSSWSTVSSVSGSFENLNLQEGWISRQLSVHRTTIRRAPYRICHTCKTRQQIQPCPLKITGPECGLMPLPNKPNNYSPRAWQLGWTQCRILPLSHFTLPNSPSFLSKICVPICHKFFLKIFFLNIFSYIWLVGSVMLVKITFYVTFFIKLRKLFEVLNSIQYGQTDTK